MRLLSILLLLTLLSACARTPQALVPQEREAEVLTVTATATEEGADLLIGGRYLSSCEEINPARNEIRIEGQRITVRLWIRRLAPVCNPIIVPFSYRLELLSLRDLPAGDYTVTVNGISTSLTLTASP